MSSLDFVFQLSPDQKLKLIHDLWDDLAANPAQMPIPDWHREELARRHAKHLANPTEVYTWDEVLEQLRSPDPG